MNAIEIMILFIFALVFLPPFYIILITIINFFIDFLYSVKNKL